MDYFLSNLFDRQGIDLGHVIEPVSGGICHCVLMTDCHLIANALFRFIWKQLSGGSLPSARCYAEFYHASGQRPNLDIPLIVSWIVMDSRGPFFIIRDTAVIRQRLDKIQQGSCVTYLLTLQSKVSTNLHQSLVEKLLDRFEDGGALITMDVIKKSMTVPLLTLFNGLIKKKNANNNDRYTNRISHMIACTSEEASDDHNASICQAPSHISVNDAVKRRFARDLHFLKHQFGKAILVSHPTLMQYGEMVRLALGSSWVIQEDIAKSLRRHLPIISSSYVALHKFGTILEPPFSSILPDGWQDTPVAMLIVFDAPSCVDDHDLMALAKTHGYDRVFRAYVEGEYRSNHVFSTSSSVVFPLYFGIEKTRDWTYPLLSSSLRAHARMACPLTSGNPMHASLLVDRCIMNISLSRGLFHSTRVFDVTHRKDNPVYTIMAVDTRHDPAATVISVLLALSSLSSHESWGVRIFCSKRNRIDFERMLTPHCPNASYDDTSVELNHLSGVFDVETNYNAFMKSHLTWQSLLPAKIVLTVQDDGVLIRRGLEKLDQGNILKGELPYIGSPWSDIAPNADMKNEIPSLVGNGGLSIRVIQDMLRITTELSHSDRHRLFHSRIEPVPEDVMFASHTSGMQHTSELYNARVKDVAMRFACEQVPFEQALGFHKQWPYWSVAQTHHHMEKMQTDESNDSNCRVLSTKPNVSPSSMLVQTQL